MKNNELETLQRRVALLQRRKKKEGRLSLEDEYRLRVTFEEIDLIFSAAVKIKSTPKKKESPRSKQKRKRIEHLKLNKEINANLMWKEIQETPATYLYLAKKLKTNLRSVHEFFKENKAARQALAFTRRKAELQGKKMCNQCFEIKLFKEFEEGAQSSKCSACENSTTTPPTEEKKEMPLFSPRELSKYVVSK